MKSKIFFISTLLCLFFSACEEDIELDLPDQNRIVIFSNFTPDSLFNLRLATTFPIDTSNNQTNNYPSDATIQLFEDGVYIDDFIFTPSQEPGFTVPSYVANQRPKPNSEYSILAKLPGFPDVRAKNTVPNNFVIDDLTFLDTMGDKIIGLPGAIFYRLNTRLKINPRNLSTGYLHLKAWRNSINFDVFGPGDTVKYIYPEILDFDISNSTEHVDILHEEGKLIDLKNLDQGEDGFDLSIRFAFFNEFELKSPLYLEVRHVSEDYFLFHKTVGEQEAANFQESLLSTQSILVHSNIENGLGYFGGYSVAVDSVYW